MAPVSESRSRSLGSFVLLLFSLFPRHHLWEDWSSPLFLVYKFSFLYLFSVDPDPPPVYQAGSYSYVCPISRLSLLFVSGFNRIHPVQASSLINMAGTFVGVFNAVVTYLP